MGAWNHTRAAEAPKAAMSLPCRPLAAIAALSVTSGFSLQLDRDVVDAESLHALLNLLQHGLIVGRVLDHQMPAHGDDAARHGPEVQVVDRLDTRHRRDTVMDIR